MGEGGEGAKAEQVGAEDRYVTHHPLPPFPLRTLENGHISTHVRRAVGVYSRR